MNSSNSLILHKMTMIYQALCVQTWFLIASHIILLHLTLKFWLHFVTSPL